MMKFDHIGIVVEDITGGRRVMQSLFGIERWTEVFTDPGIGVYVQFGIGADGPCYELIAPLRDQCPITNALRTGKGILNHVAYIVPDIASTAARLRDQGCFPVAEAQAAVAYGGRLVQFFQSPLRFIIELIEAPEHSHEFALK
jgi:methylmalonyl-CoA/ethylmalonyl-CoA epimerase